MKLPVHRIIPFSNVEGYGNRTSIFVQGCNANCLYCHNSETIPMTSKDSSSYSIEELLIIIRNQIPFIRGITISGGEATLYPTFIRELFLEVKKLNLTCYIDTNGFFDFEELLPLIDVTDKFLFDIKGLGGTLDSLCFSKQELMIHTLTKHSSNYSQNNAHLKNLVKLLEMDKVEEVRVVYVKNYYDINYVIDTLHETLKNYPLVLFKLIKMHSRGLPKDRIIALKGSIPSIKDFESVSKYVESKNFHKTVFIN